MKKSDIQKIKDKNNVQLEKDLVEAKGELQILKFNLAAGKMKNLREIKEIKKKIARILTFMKQKLAKCPPVTGPLKAGKVNG